MTVFFSFVRELASQLVERCVVDFASQCLGVLFLRRLQHSRNIEVLEDNRFKISGQRCRKTMLAEVSCPGNPSM
jgi:hypothetical protein